MGEVGAYERAEIKSIHLNIRFCENIDKRKGDSIEWSKSSRRVARTVVSCFMVAYSAGDGAPES